MHDAEERFVEEMGQFLGRLGMTPMAGRMWGWLLICDPPEQTAAEIAEALHASRGAISGTARILASAGLIRRTTRRGDRREYFSVAARGARFECSPAPAASTASCGRSPSAASQAIADRPPESREPGCRSSATSSRSSSSRSPRCVGPLPRASTRQRGVSRQDRSRHAGEGQ